MRSSNLFAMDLKVINMDLWDEIEEKDYLPFAKFAEDNGKTEIMCQLADNEPSLFKNKWGKEQFSIRVWLYKLDAKKQLKLIENDTEQHLWLLCGGVRLFRELKKAKDFEGVLQLRRLGSGFETNYKIIKKIKQK